MDGSGRSIVIDTVPTWHERSATVHHNNAECYLGGKIRQAKRLEGTGDKPLCAACGQLNNTVALRRNRRKR